MEKFYKSVLELDRFPVVLCNPEHTILYMNPAAKKAYAEDGGAALLGSNVLDCHPEYAKERLLKVVEWFKVSPKNNMVFTVHSSTSNKDIYMVALRDEGGNLIGYYERHESRDLETAKAYDFERSLV